MLRSLFLASLLAAGCTQAQIGLIASAIQDAQPGATKQTPLTSLKKVVNASLALAKDSSYDVFTVYRSNQFDFVTGTDGTSDDFGQAEFMSLSGLSDKDDNGYFLYGRKYVSQPVDLGFIEVGDEPFASIKEAPEYGWSVSEVSKRNQIKLKANLVFLFRAKYTDTRETYYGKIWIKDMSSSQILFDYHFQLNAGDRRLD